LHYTRRFPDYQDQDQNQEPHMMNLRQLFSTIWPCAIECLACIVVVVAAAAAAALLKSPKPPQKLC